MLWKYISQHHTRYGQSSHVFFPGNPCRLAEIPKSLMTIHLFIGLGAWHIQTSTYLYLVPRLEVAGLCKIAMLLKQPLANLIAGQRLIEQLTKLWVVLAWEGHGAHPRINHKKPGIKTTQNSHVLLENNFVWGSFAPWSILIAHGHGSHRNCYAGCPKPLLEG